MRRLSATTLLFVALSSAGVGATTGTTTHTTARHAVKAKKLVIHYAPADEYFGPSKMSLLGIRNQLHDLSLQYDVDHASGRAIFGKAKFAEASLRDWSKKYPSDPDIARHIYLLSHLYGKIIEVDGASQREAGAQHWLLVQYPATWYAKDEKKRIALSRKEEEQQKNHPETQASPADEQPVPRASAGTVFPTALPTMLPTVVPTLEPVPVSSMPIK